MKTKNDWQELVFGGLILLFTSFATFSLNLKATDAVGIWLYTRAAISVFVTEGALVYWRDRRAAYSDDKQRNYATWGLVFAVIIVILYSGLYVAESLVATGQIDQFQVDLGFGAVPLRTAAGYVLNLVIFAQVAFNLPLLLIVEGKSPAAKLAIEKARAQATLNEKTLTAFKSGQAAIAHTLGTEAALSELRKQLAGMGYTERDAEMLVQAARLRIEQTSVSLPAPMIIDASAYTQTTAPAPVPVQAAEVATMANPFPQPALKPNGNGHHE